jgi:UDP-glucose 4-epimerase
VKCLVSGATGFIGSSLCQRLLRDSHTLIPLSQSGAPLADGTPSRALDLARTLPDTALLEGVEAYTELNERATRALARRAAEAGVRRFVFLSSVKAMGPSSGESPRAEGDCSAPADAYGRSKWRAECALHEAFKDSAMSVVILRPALVYGPRAKGNLALLARGISAGLPRPPERGCRSMVALDDLVEALCLVATRPLQGVHTWIVADSRGYSSRYLYDQLRRAGGRPVGRSWLPLPLWRLAATAMDLVIGGAGESTYQRLFGTELYCSAALTEATGWRPRVRFEAVAAAMMGSEVRGGTGDEEYPAR